MRLSGAVLRHLVGVVLLSALLLTDRKSVV